jgi:hypothetical protein
VTARLLIGVALLMTLSPVAANAASERAVVLGGTALAQASPSPTPATETPSASPSPGKEGNEGGITSAAGIVIAAILIGGLLLMRTRLLRR